MLTPSNKTAALLIEGPSNTRQFLEIDHCNASVNEFHYRHHKVIKKGMGNSDLVFYPFNNHLAIHRSVVLRFFQFCDPARQKLAGHLRLLV